MCGWWGGTARCAAVSWPRRCRAGITVSFALAVAVLALMLFLSHVCLCPSSLVVVAQRCLCLHLLVPVPVLAALSPPPCHMPPALIAALLLRVQVRWLAQGIPTKSELEDMSSLTKDLLNEGSKRGQKSEGGGKAGGGRRRRRG